MRNMGEFECPFCDELLQDCISVKKEEPCCENEELLSDNGMNVCQSCGVVHGYDLRHGSIDFHENKYKITRKSVYHRKYHIQNTIDKYAKIQLSCKDREKILYIIQLIGDNTKDLDTERKRFISIEYLLKRIYDMLGYKNDFFKLPKSKKTLNTYNRYWDNLWSLIGIQIQSIIDRH